jgi:hypothetical protein
MVLLSYVEVITSKVLRVDRHGISVPQMTKDNAGVAGMLLHMNGKFTMGTL